MSISNLRIKLRNYIGGHTYREYTDEEIIEAIDDLSLEILNYKSVLMKISTLDIKIAGATEETINKILLREIKQLAQEALNNKELNCDH